MTLNAWSILSISLLTVMAGAAVAPALGAVQAAFPDVSPTTIKLLLTAPSVCIIPMSFLAPRICARLGVRRTLLLGGALYLLGGAGGGLATSFPMLLATRIVLGIGVGLVMPMSNSLVSVFFAGEERVRMMGRTASTANLGGIVALFCSGWLAQANWRYAFAIYAISLVTMTMAALFLQEPPPEQSPAAATGRLPLGAWLGALGLLLLMIVFYCIPTNLALFLIREGYGEAANSGMSLAGSTTAGFVAGLILPRTRLMFGRQLPLVMLCLMAAGFFCLHYATGLASAMGGVVLVGFGLGSLWPSLLVAVARATPLPLSMRAMALAGSMIFLGQFLSPLVFDAVGVLLDTRQPRDIFGLAGLATGAAVLGMALLGRQVRRMMEQRA
ncbi:MFS transporter [Megalodesulfovibrio gigas]|uniref:Putative major facilitator superfamily protein n=1 Tax=Megalodesulfovibrio gigas (strain ATCC 19364 / DSM 1382 / NCIMB 9332 / VKM B-1759) TaxID=1121448 RepID=T2GG70_MEGG1|nr:MFS transporter [Megalodesulfovibrio gigas]AGW15176.1 putative major facilitator superfamily protein [Megalodesulfovibrio gigas DSM 1382 = ATCC 19364]